MIALREGLVLDFTQETARWIPQKFRFADRNAHRKAIIRSPENNIVGERRRIIIELDLYTRKCPYQFFQKQKHDAYPMRQRTIFENLFSTFVMYG